MELTTTPRDYERIVNNNAGAIPANLIDTNCSTLCIIITACNDILVSLALSAECCYTYNVNK